MAYHYYKDRCEIECFIDNAGKKINGISVCALRILEQVNLQDTRIIIANRGQRKQIFEQLHAQYGISEHLFFYIKIIVGEYVVSNKENRIENECIISYRSGLGGTVLKFV